MFHTHTYPQKLCKTTKIGKNGRKKRFFLKNYWIYLKFVVSLPQIFGNADNVNY